MPQKMGELTNLEIFEADIFKTPARVEYEKNLTFVSFSAFCNYRQEQFQKKESRRKFAR